MEPRKSHQKHRPIRIHDVASAANVSRTTASDALNGSGRVSPKTRALVIATAKGLGYRPNAHARMLKRGRSGILVVISSLSTDDSIDLTGAEYFAGLLTSSATTALSYGYGIVLLPPSPDIESFDAVIGDGALLLDPVAGGTLAHQLESSGLPTVSTGRVPGISSDGSTWVDNDIASSSGLMLDLLKTRGARRIALVTNPPIRSYTIDTLETYRAWTQKHGFDEQVITTDTVATESSAYRAMREVLSGSNLPDAIYSPLDRLASGAMLAIRSAGLRVPEDVLIASGSDSLATRSANPAITSLELNADQIGKRAIELLIDRVEGKTTGHGHVIVDAEIKERTSTMRK